MAGLPGWIGGLGNNTIVQMAMMQIVGQLIGAGLAPYTAELTAQLYHETPLLPLSPADLANAVIRGLLDEANAADQAAYSGYDAARFHTLVGLTGQVPPPEAAAEALRRGLIDQPGYEDIIRKGNLRPEYATLMRELSVQEPSPQAVLGALLEGQVTESFARKRFAELGGDLADFQWLFDSNGSAPTPMEAITMAKRGVIGWTGTGPKAVSYEQAFLEGPWRNKWADAYKALGDYLPPPRTVTAMAKAGSLTHDQAAGLLTKQGLTPELVAAYLSDASAQKVTGAKDIAVGLVRSLYADQIVTKDAAMQMLQDIGYDVNEAGFELAVQDAAIGQRFLSAAVGRIHSLYVGHKVTKDAAAVALRELGTSEQAITQLVGIWDIEERANVKLLTVAEIVGALKLSIMDAPTAITELQGLGYTAYDAWVVLSVHTKVVQPNPPAPDA